MLLYLGKVANYFSFTQDVSTKGHFTWARQALLGLSYGPLLLISLLRLAQMRRYPLSAVESLLTALFFLNALFAVIFFTRIRYRIPFDYTLIALVALFLDRLASQWLGGWTLPGAGVIADSTKSKSIQPLLPLEDSGK